jgi:hypothetical protein
MDSLSEKIRRFLNDAGFEFAGDRCSNLELFRYFEREYGLEVMRLMEQEWVQQQLEREADQDFFTQLRSHVDKEHLSEFDSDVSSIWDQAA